MAGAEAGHIALQAALRAARIANPWRWQGCNRMRIFAARPYELVLSRPLFMVNITKF